MCHCVSKKYVKSLDTTFRKSRALASLKSAMREHPVWGSLRVRRTGGHCSALVFPSLADRNSATRCGRLRPKSPKRLLYTVF